MQERERRLALADFLRQRRASLSPADVGLPPGVRRRTPGLRREEVAQLANIGASWYVWLEQGRDVRPSAQALGSLAQAFRLTLNERRRLFLLAGQPPPPSGSPAEELLRPALQQMVDALDPIPASVLGSRWDYLAWNKAADALFSVPEASSPYARNLIWQTFTNPMRRESPYWEAIARAMLGEFRATSMRHPGGAWFEELIEDLKRVSPEFREWWPHHDVRRALDGHKVIEHPTMGRLEFEHFNLQSLSDPDIKVMIYAPDAATRAKLERFLQARSAAQPQRAELRDAIASDAQASG
jgi:transcriptional regulator with XRE-family HTH domain